MNTQKARLSVVSFGIAVGVWWGWSLFMLAVLAWKTRYGAKAVVFFSSLYSSYAPSLSGCLWGLLWGFIDGLIAGLIIALVYNICVYSCCNKKCG